MSDGMQITCATYTHARRHPMVIGHIAGWTPPFQLTLTQIGILVVGYVVEFKTWRWWGGFLPPLMRVVLALVVPALLAWAVRATRFEGRSVARAALGWLGFLLVPRTGWVGGRPNRPTRPVSLTGHRVLVAPGPVESGP